MKELTKKGLLYRIIIISVVIVTLFNFTCPTIVFADDEEDESDMGGVLFTPIQALVLGLGDVCMWILNKSAGYDGPTKVTLEKGFFAKVEEFLDDSIWGWVLAPGRRIGKEIVDAIIEPEKDWPASIIIPFYAVTPDKIFSNRVPLFNVNIMNPPEDSPAYEIQDTISKWYNALKNFAIVGLLIVLVYIAIRIIISSTATDKSKYKQMFMDWIVAFCLIFFMHYIMSFSITVVEAITNSLVDTNGQVAVKIPQDTYDNDYDSDEKELVDNLLEIDENGKLYVDESGCYHILMDYTSYIRYRVQVNGSSGAGKAGIAQSGWQKMGFTIMYAVLVIYTVMFSIGYLKRFVYLTYLTMISTLVALTYPIDKIRDGKAQGFNTWLKEYLYNLIIQPVHLILYTVLIGTAMDLSTKYLLYPLVVLGFLLEAEKVVRKLFGFDNSSTASSIANGALGGALIMQGINSLSRRMGKSKDAKGDSEETNKIRYSDRKADKPDGFGEFVAGTFGTGNGRTPNTSTNRSNTQNTNMPNTNTSQSAGNSPNTSNGTSQSQRRSHNMGQQLTREQRYNNDGYGRNAEGHYFNPYTDEYDENYSPANDPNYASAFEDEIMDKYSSEGYGQNAEGHYFNPYTDEYDENYSPLDDPNYNNMSYDMPDDVQEQEVNNSQENIEPEQNEQPRTVDFGENIEENDNRNVIENNDKKYSRINGIKAVAGTYIKPKKIAKAVGRGAVKAVTAGTLGTIGVAAGLASDNFANVGKYGLAGGAAGVIAGNKIIGKGKNIATGARNAKQVYEQAAYSKEEYNKLQNQRADKAFMKDDKVVEQYKKAFKGKKKINGEEAYKVAMQKALKYREQGITDNDVIIKAMKASTAGVGDDWDSRERIIAAKLASQASNEKDVQNIEQRLIEKGVQQEDARRETELIREIKDLF